MNSWLMYRRHCNQFKIKTYDDLKTFKSKKAQGLHRSGKDKGKKRIKSNSQIPPSRKNIIRQKLQRKMYDIMVITTNLSI